MELTCKYPHSVSEDDLSEPQPATTRPRRKTAKPAKPAPLPTIVTANIDDESEPQSGPPSPQEEDRHHRRRLGNVRRDRSVPARKNAPASKKPKPAQPPAVHDDGFDSDSDCPDDGSEYEECGSQSESDVSELDVLEEELDVDFNSGDDGKDIDISEQFLHGDDERDDLDVDKSENDPGSLLCRCPGR